MICSFENSIWLSYNEPFASFTPTASQGRLVVFSLPLHLTPLAFNPHSAVMCTAVVRRVPLSLTCHRQCFDADAVRQMHKRCAVARVKTAVRFEGLWSVRRTSQIVRNEHRHFAKRRNYLVRRPAKAGRKRNGQDRSRNVTHWRLMFWTFIWRCQNEVWHQHQI